MLPKFASCFATPSSVVSKQCIKCESASSRFQSGEALEGAFSVIMKTDGSFGALINIFTTGSAGCCRLVLAGPLTTDCSS